MNYLVEDLEDGVVTDPELASRAADAVERLRTHAAFSSRLHPLKPPVEAAVESRPLHAAAKRQRLS